jgi:DNA replication regulator DPB11
MAEHPAAVSQGAELDAEDRPEIKSTEYMPSQSLLYEDPEVQAAREDMIRRMGGKVEEVVGVVSPIGVVRDVVTGVAGRVGRRRKGG